MIKYNYIIYSLIFLLLVSTLKGQTYHFKNYTVDDGLSSSEVYHVIQDKKGFVWIATNQGVCRFDGYQFTNFDNQSGLPRNTILELFEDNKGRIWFVSLSGELSWFENDSIYIYPYNDLILDYNKGNHGRPLKKSFYADSMNEVYIGFNQKLLIKISNDGILTEIKSEKGTKRQVLKVLPQNNLVFSSYQGVMNGIELQIEKKPDMVIPGKFPYVKRFMACSVDGAYVFATLNVLHVAYNNGIVKQYTFKNKIIWISQDAEGNIWLGFLWGGAVAYSGLDFKEKKYSLLENESVSSVSRDIEGGYWISTIENGLFYFPDIQVKTFTQKDGFSIKSISQTEKHRNEIWLAGNSKDIYVIKDGQLELQDFGYVDDKVSQCNLIKSLGDSIVFGFFGDSDKNSRMFYNKKEVWSTKEYTRDIVVLGGDSLIRAYGSISIYGMKGKELFKIVQSDTFFAIYAMIKISRSRILLGTDNGLLEYSVKSNQIKEVNFSPLLRTRINCFYKDPKDKIWIGTKGAGLLSIRGEKVTQFSTKDGLPGNSVNSIEKKDSILWLATNKGIGKVFLNEQGDFILSNNYKNYKIETYTRSNGLLNNEIFDIALDENYLYAGTNNGLSYFKQKLSGKNNVVPPIYFTGIKVMGKDTVIEGYYELNHGHNYIEFNFIGLSYQREKALKYAYILEGVNNEWVITENRSANYPMLPPGTYTFKVKAFNRSGLESEIRSIKIKINKAYYQTLLFKLTIVIIVLLIIISIFAFVFYIKMKEVKKRNAVLDELNKFRQQALSAQMNPHFIYNSLNSVQSYILKNDRLKSSEYLSKFSNLMRKVLDNSQNSFITLHEEFEALNLYIEMELIRFRNSFYYTLNIQDNIDLKEFDIPPLILQPFVENAIHHGLRIKDGDKKLKINVFKKENRVCIHIEDNGIGRDEALKIKQKKLNTYKSYGTEITTKRLELFKESYKNKVKLAIFDLKSDLDESQGTKVEIELL